MDNNDILRRLRYALNITDLRVIDLFKLSGYDMAKPELEGIFKREDEPGYIPCGDSLLGLFLDGLVIDRRGRREEPGPGREGAAGTRLSNNDVLKRIRIALELKDVDMIEIMRLAGVDISKPELNALFRKRDHQNFRPCGDQFLRNFLVGLTAKSRV
jgi:uncharacterized protein YehS (DUF1456 family)